MKKVLSLFFVLMCSCFTTANAFFGFNKKAVDPKPIEYYILGDDLARQFDVVNSPSFHVEDNGRYAGWVYISKSNVSKSSSFHIMEDGYYLSRIFNKYDNDDIKLCSYENYFTTSYIYEDDIFRSITNTNDRVSIENRASRGIVNIFGYDFNDDDMGGAKVFVPAVRSGELSAREFKEQLRIGNVLNKGLIRTEKKARMIEPKMDEFNFIYKEKYNNCIVSFVLNIVKRFSSPEMLDRIEKWSMGGYWHGANIGKVPNSYRVDWSNRTSVYKEGYPDLRVLDYDNNARIIMY